MRGYYEACCGCGLVHAKQHRVYIDHRGKAQVEFRARRAPRYTAQERRKLKG